MFRRLATASIALAIIAAACSSNTATQGVAGATSGAGGNAPGTATVKVASANGKTFLVAGANGMTVYNFANDTPNNGKSACSGGCVTIWPALTVPSGTTPTEGSGASGKIGTITRDDGTTQVTYNGMPLYFYKSDSKPGDTLGNYPGWNLVTP